MTNTKYKVEKRLGIKTEASSLSRLYSKMQQGDCAVISAFRGENTKKENLQKTKSLKLKLARPGLDITAVSGSFVENFGTPEAMEVREISFFICDTKGRYDLKKIVSDLGKEFDQESIFFIKQGGKEAYLVGTSENGYPGLGEEKKFSGLSLGKDNQFMTKVANRPFYFSEVEESSYNPSVASMQGILTQARKHWSYFGDTELEEFSKLANLL